QSRGSRRAGAVGGRPRRRAEQHRQRRDEVHARDEQDERRDGRPAVPAQPDPQPAEGAAVPLVLAVAVQSGGGRGGRGFRRLGVGRGGEAEGLPRGGLLPFHPCLPRKVGLPGGWWLDLVQSSGRGGCGEAGEGGRTLLNWGALPTRNKRTVRA
ncbi:hypothetical protein THAOC_20564, partial [Thalassiosira oceanica]